MKKVLIISFIYPPLGGSGVQRTLKFSRYLHEFGWQPYIICCNDPDVFGHGIDLSLISEIPGHVKVWRKPFISPYEFRRRIQKIFKIKLKNEQAILSAGNNELISRYSDERFLQKALRWIGKFFYPFEVPPIDTAIYWSISIIPLCLRIIRKEKIDLVYTTSFPYSDHVAGYIIKVLTKKPWVADFRDPWTQNATYQNMGWRRQIDAWIEKKIIDNSDRVIAVTPTYTQAFGKLSNSKHIDHFVTIENGYDQDDFAFPVYTEKNNDTITIAHTGIIYPETALPLFMALDKLDGIGSELRLQFVGGISPDIENWLKNHALPIRIEVLPRVEHAKAIEYMRRANVLLLIVGNEKKWIGHYPGKLFEYMASGTPILMIGPAGDAANLIERSKTGCAIRSEDIDGLIQVLRLIAKSPAQFRNKFYNPGQNVISGYERKYLTKKLSDVFNTLSK